jgi:hypothetical protein
MSIDNGSEPSGRFSGTVAVGAAVLDDALGARGFGVDLADRAGFSTAGRGLLAERVVFGIFGAVLEPVRFLFSGMPLEIIPSVGGCDQLD